MKQKGKYRIQKVGNFGLSTDALFTLSNLSKGGLFKRIMIKTVIEN
jgi:hypothetical protein